MLQFGICTGKWRRLSLDLPIYCWPSIKKHAAHWAPFPKNLLKKQFLRMLAKNILNKILFENKKIYNGILQSSAYKQRKNGECKVLSFEVMINQGIKFTSESDSGLFL